LVYLSTVLIVEIYTDHYVTLVSMIANLTLVWNSKGNTGSDHKVKGFLVHTFVTIPSLGEFLK